MRAGELLSRIGLGPQGGPGDGLAWRLLLVPLALYFLSVAAFYPRAVTNVDEGHYVAQSQLVLEGRSTVLRTDPGTGEQVEHQPSTYPLGTALLMAPFVWAFGWRGGFAAPLLSLAICVLVTTRWIREEDRSPLFALLVLGFVPALVMGRVAMSDVPSAAVAALGLWCFWRGLDRGIGWWLAAGFLAGASMIFRANNPFLFVPLFAGTVIRREVRCWALVVGGLAGLALRPLTMYWYFGEAFFERGAYAFAPHSLEERVPLYLLGLLILVPGGLILSLLYKGRRRPEVVSTIVLVLAFFLFQRYSSVAAGPLKRVVLALRYFIPLLPIMAFAMSESVPRLWRHWVERAAPARRLLMSSAIMHRGILRPTHP